MAGDAIPKASGSGTSDRPPAKPDDQKPEKPSGKEPVGTANKPPGGTGPVKDGDKGPAKKQSIVVTVMSVMLSTSDRGNSTDSHVSYLPVVTFEYPGCERLIICI